MDIQQHPFFDFFKGSTAKKLIQASEVKLFPSTTVIFHEGEASDSLYLVLRGNVSLTKGEPDSADIASVTAGDFFGEFGVLDGQPRSATATASGDAQLAVISRKALLSKLGSSADAAALRMAIQIITKVRKSNRQHVEDLLKCEKLNLLGRMVSCLTHDFRVPFEAISAASEALCAESDKKFSDYGHAIHAQIDRVRSLTDDVRDYAQEELSLRKTNVDIQELIEKLQASTSAFLSTLQITLHIETESYTLQVDEQKILRSLQNFIYTAAEKFRGRPGEISIRQEVLEDGVCLHIRDNGPEIPMASQLYLFEPFTNPDREKHGGLGMTITHHFIEAHGGNISLSSSADETVFRLFLPQS